MNDADLKLISALIRAAEYGSDDEVIEALDRLRLKSSLPLDVLSGARQ